MVGENLLLEINQSGFDCEGVDLRGEGWIKIVVADYVQHVSTVSEIGFPRRGLRSSRELLLTDLNLHREG